MQLQSRLVEQIHRASIPSTNISNRSAKNVIKVLSSLLDVR